ncbi:DUF1491 family protein [Pseudonocardia sp. TMWB2A]|uniref:DUF1491 family protein n=1 Tax=Pseudonocardia sp. TMWB2A TaxID=687430 RepID=UPI00307F30BB
MIPEPRLASSVIIAALRRKVEAVGGFATVLAKGDAVAGAILIVCPQGASGDGAGHVSGHLSDDTRQGESHANTGPESGPKPVILEREPTFDGPGKWIAVGRQHIDNEQKLSEYLVKRRASDPDLWIIELDTADAERFAAEITGSA